MKQLFSLESVLDVGCGAGAWLAVWKENNTVIAGLDGDYVNRDGLYIEKEEFIPQDLSKPFNLDRKFSLVQSLEVAEHLPTETSSQFVADLCSHADIVFFSAAPPGQGGDNHVNEQKYEFWRQLFVEQKYIPLDIIRTQFANNKSVERWYRYNSFVYVSQEIFDGLPEKIKTLEIKREIQDISPPVYKLRKAFIRLIPIFVATKIAKVKENTSLLLFRMKG